MKKTNQLSRRDFIRVVSISGTGLILAVYLPSVVKGQKTLKSFEPNAFLSIDPSGIVTITVARSEMGQGVHTSLPMLVAEELEVDWNSVRIEQALSHPTKYGSMVTGGSTSIRDSWDPLRKAGATAREMLVTAAAEIWKVDKSTCRAKNGLVIHDLTGRQSNYGELADKAAGLLVPTDVTLKNPKDFNILGKSIHRLDVEAKNTGKAVFGIDVKIPGMFVATVSRCPIFGGKVKSFDAANAKKIKGVVMVLQIPSGIAVVAENSWAAIKGQEALVVTWDEGPNTALSSASIHQFFMEESKKVGEVARKEGDPITSLTNAVNKIEAVYELPFLAHATMETMNCTADVRENSAELWLPVQTPQWTQRAVSSITKLPPEKVKIHITLLGGGFGRRLMWDFAGEATILSMIIKNPVKVIWTREDDIQSDFYRPASCHRLQGSLDHNGQPLTWVHHMTGPSITAQLFPDQPRQGPPDAIDGAAQLPYYFPNVLIDYVMANTPVRVTWWRSVYHSQNAFVNECFMDELAVLARKDPYEFRMSTLPKDSRLKGVLELAAKKAEWKKSLPAGHAHGIACHFSFGSYVAYVAEVSVDRGSVQVHRVVAAVDCGLVINPTIVEAQIQGAVAFGLTSVIKDEITIEKGRVIQNNFDGYSLLSIDEMPEVEVHIVPSKEAPGGIGEVGVPPIGPAILNAVFGATGRRIRKLPIKFEDLK